MVGPTGAGKSSVINALLDEESLIPTSGMRACTATVTEISWNYKAGKTKYNADIHFQTISEWKDEMEILFGDINEEGQLESDIKNPESEAGIAFAKIKAVYPEMIVQIFLKSNPEQLINELLKQIADQNIMGSVKHIGDDYVESFTKKLQAYVDAGETPQELPESTKLSKPAMQVWPLITVVKIRTNAPVLSTGVVLVDLSGVQDSNAARSAIAKNYLQRCDSLLVVAPITRAVSDKAARNLLGDRFKRQLNFDGILSSLIFVCSKTDDHSSKRLFRLLDLRKILKKD